MPPALDPVTQHHLDQAAERLADEFAGIFSRETIARYMADSKDLLGEARINVFVPVLAHRFTRERLKALAQAEEPSRRSSRRCCSSACTTPAAARWPQAW